MVRPRVAVAASLAVTLGYAIVRYHVYGGVDWSQLPLFTFNKAVSFSAAILLGCAYLPSNAMLRRTFGLAGFSLSMLHVLMSAALLTPAHYPKLYVDGRFTSAGGICVLGGCVALLLLLVPASASSRVMKSALTSEEWLARQRVGYWALAAAFVHVFALGFKGWFDPASWPGGLPPITMFSCALLAAPLAGIVYWRLSGRRS
jgi:DMSO/TMAO reductase YedYZ heme-binding membrane subunit